MYIANYQYQKLDKVQGIKILQKHQNEWKAGLKCFRFRWSIPLPSSPVSATKVIETRNHPINQYKLPS